MLLTTGHSRTLTYLMNCYRVEEKEPLRTTDGHSITWISTDLGSVDNRWVSME